MASSKQGLSKIVLPSLLNISICVINKKKEIIILKLDFEKAFDKMEHAAMLQIMKAQGFSNTWLSWMKSIVFGEGLTSMQKDHQKQHGKWFVYQRKKEVWESSTSKLKMRLCC